MSPRWLPGKHADAHRPAGTLGPDDPGGSDAITLPGGSGIMFNTDNEGGYLDITTNDGDPSDQHWGFSLTDKSTEGLAMQAVSDGALLALGAPKIAINTNEGGVIGGDTVIGGSYPHYVQVIGTGGGPNPGDGSSPSIALLDTEDYGVLIASDNNVSINTVSGYGGDINLWGESGGGFLNVRGEGALFYVDIGMETNGITNMADGVNPQDAATVAQLGGAAGVSTVTDGVTTVASAVEIDFTSGATVTDGGGGVAQVAISAGIDFDTVNSGDWFTVETSGADGSARALYLHNTSSTGNLVLLSDTEGIYIESGGSGGFIELDAAEILSYVGAGGEATVYDSSANPMLWLEDGVTSAPTEGQVLTGHLGAAATWEDPSAGGGIAFDTANSGDWLDITTTGFDADNLGIHLHDTDATTGLGILLESDAHGIEGKALSIYMHDTAGAGYFSEGYAEIFTATGEDLYLYGDNTSLTLSGSSASNSATFQMQAGGTFVLLDSSSNPMLQMTEGDPNLYIKTGGVLSATL